MIGYGGRNARLGENGNRSDNPRIMSGNGKEQRQGQFFVLMPGDLRNNGDVCAGTILICSIPAYDLFNSGPSHIFISTHFASRMNKELTTYG